MFPSYHTDPIMGSQSNPVEFVDFFDNFKGDDLGYDLTQVAIPPIEVLDQSIDSDDDDFLTANLPEFSKPVHYENGPLISNGINEVSKDQLFPNYFTNSNENLPNVNTDYSLNAHFSNSCSLYPMESSVGSLSAYDSTSPYSNDFNSISPLTFGAEASNQYDRQYGSPESSSCSFDSNSVEASSGSSEYAATRTRKALKDLTDEEKYLRIREQNNIASREYRNRKKTKKSGTETQLQELVERNKRLKLAAKALENKYKMCLKAKAIFENAGINFSNLNLS